jgi:proteasome accessory factor C
MQRSAGSYRQRLTHYRENWYLNARCYTRQALHGFAVDLIRQPELRDQPAEAIADPDRFIGARWLAAEAWQARYQGDPLRDDRDELHGPYSRAEGLILDVLRCGADVEVLVRSALRADVVRRLFAAAVIHEADSEITTKIRLICRSGRACANG